MTSVQTSAGHDAFVARTPKPLTFRAPESVSAGQPASFSSGPGRFGWVAAAACLLIAAAAWWPSGTVGVETASLSGRVAALAGTASDLDRWDWAPWDEQYAGVGGEVIWSESAQEGYMILSGLPENDAETHQYQLWVVESSRGTPLEVPPVDGGVFNVAYDGSGQAIIPIDPAIRAEGVVAFAVTLESPGGVVVSDQSRRVVIAQATAEQG
ncbi:MAG: anti-sigma factor [Planctomycetota bacterium]